MSILTRLAALAAPLAIAAATLAPQQAEAREPFLGEIMLFGPNFCPRGWANAEGQLLPIAQNTALFSLFGTIYGGDGRTTFGLPDLRGRVPLGRGTGPGLTPYSQGMKGGSEQVTLNPSQLPPHNHKMAVNNSVGHKGRPNNDFIAPPWDRTPGNGVPVNKNFASTAEEGKFLNQNAITNTGGGQAHENRMPYLAMRWCVALTGIFPSRN